MKIEITGDYFADSGIEMLLDELYSKLTKNFKKKIYSDIEPDVFIVVICQPHKLSLRRKFIKKDNTLYYDIILDYKHIKEASISEKQNIMALAIINSLEWLSKYNFDIDIIKIKKDMTMFFEKIKWLKR